MEDLDAASLDEFLEYRDTYYTPNNAVLVVAGDIDTDKTRKMISDYFGPIPKGNPIDRSNPSEAPIEETIHTTAHDPNIQVPAAVLAYRMPGFREREAYVLEMISSYLSDGKSSRLYKKLVDVQKQALQVGAFNINQEDYGIYLVYSLPVGDNDIDTLMEEMEEEIARVREELISERDYQKLQNTFENQFVNANSSIAGIAGSLATYYMLYGDTDLINSQIDIYRSINREEILEVAQKYLKPSQRVELKYLPQEPVQN
jgi:zinc protease